MREAPGPEVPPFEYLMAGDVVERRWRHPRGYVCVKVISSRSAPEDTVGWVVGSALRAP